MFCTETKKENWLKEDANICGFFCVSSKGYTVWTHICDLAMP